MTRPHDAGPLAAARVRLADLPARGRKLTLELDGDQRRHLAGELGISALEQFEVRLLIRPVRGAIHVTGTLAARVVQPCVVSFAPVEQAIDEPVDRIFLGGPAPEAAEGAGAEVFVDLERDDLPDYFEGSELDLAALLVEVLSLAIDPYPRASGVQLPARAGGDDDGAPASAFAALGARIKNNET